MIVLKDVVKYFSSGGKGFIRGGNVIKAVNGVTLSVNRGKTFGLVGESGCGKSTVAKLIAGILKPDAGCICTSGTVDMVFQDPFSSLNPRMNVRQIVGEALLIRGIAGPVIKERVSEVLSAVRMYSPGIEERFPHEFSGGQRQRIAIARSLIRDPEILVLDEPVSNLDVSIQAGILNLLKDIQEEKGITYLFISHDLRVVEFMSDTVGVMKDGEIIETASKEEIYSSPRTVYTSELLNSLE